MKEGDNVDNITIDSEFQSLIPPLTDDEFQRLEKSILSEGVREPIITWSGTIIDGNNRYKICTKHGLVCPNREREFDSRDAAKIWIIENQFGRRNLDKYDRGVLALQLKWMYAAEAKRRQGTRTDLSQKSDESQHIRTDEQIAKLAGMSRDTIRKVAVIENEANSGNETAIAARESVKDGSKSIHKAFTEIRHKGNESDKRNICTMCGKPIDEGDYYPRDVFKHKSCANKLEHENKKKAKESRFADDGRRICSICGEPINPGECYDYEPTFHKKCRYKQHVVAQRKYRDAEHSLRENVPIYNSETLLIQLLTSAQDLRNTWMQIIQINEDMGVKLAAKDKSKLEAAASNLINVIESIRKG